MLPLATFRDRLLMLLGRRHAFRVAGDSMLPTLRDGDVVLVRPRPRAAEGCIVIAKHPYKKSVRILKRVAAVSADGRLTLAGDNPDASTDSRVFGSVSIECILGEAVCRLK